MGLHLSILIILGLAVTAPLLARLPARLGGLLLAAVVATLAGGLGSYLPAVQAGHYPTEIVPWVPALEVALHYRLDGLGLLFALLILGIGALILIYVSGYCEDRGKAGRLYSFLLVFMAGMLGLVLSDHLLGLFIYWELTSIASYLLISFNVDQAKARANARQALLITAGGGAALLAGLLFLAEAAGTMVISEILAGGSLGSEVLYAPALILIFLGAATKSAQVPFHFWLPNAMAAPTPVSAYLHSATMVKAGVFLLARFQPALGGTDLWTALLVPAGAVTFLGAALLGLSKVDLKSILAHTTLSVLGLLVLLLGLGAPLALKSAMLFLFGHALYKAALFMVVGGIDHATHTRDVQRLGNLRKLMPMTALAALLAALSKAGFPPFFGFLGKEYVYKAGSGLEIFAEILLTVCVIGNLVLLALAFKVGLHPFWGKPTAAEPAQKTHGLCWQLWLPPLVLGVLGVLAGLFPVSLAQPLLKPATIAVAGEAMDFKLALWHGINLPLILSIATLAGGITLYMNRKLLWRQVNAMPKRPSLFEKAYAWALEGLVKGSQAFTRFTINGRLSRYVGFTVLVIFALVAVPTYQALIEAPVPALQGGSLIEWSVVALAAAGALLAALSSRRLVALCALGTVGYGLALVFAWHGGMDVAITQVLVETILLAIFVVALGRLRDGPRENAREGTGHLSLAVLAGLVMAALAWLGNVTVHPEPISAQLSNWSYVEAHGRNIVNVILVDFRAIDTFGEIIVLGIAASGVWLLLRRHAHEDKP